MEGEPGAGVTIEPAHGPSWPAVESVLGRRGSVKGCWCMFFRQTPQERREQWGDGNRAALRELVDAGREPGLIAHVDGEPAGWCSIAPREEFSRLDRSPLSRRIDDQPVWALVCLYVVPEQRGAGLSRRLVDAALDHGASRGAEIVEAYPVDDAPGPVPVDRAYHGTVSLLRSFGFEEVARRQELRPVMRLDVSDRRRAGAGDGP